MKSAEHDARWILAICTLLMLAWPVIAQDQWPRLDCYDDMPDEQYVPLLSQCGIRVAYVAIQANGHNVSLAELVHRFRGDLRIEREGLSVGQLVEVIRDHGGKCEPGRMPEDGFLRIPFEECVLIVLMNADNCNGHSGHYEVVLGRDGDKVLMTRWGERPRWVKSEAVQALLAGPVVLVKRQTSMNSGHVWWWSIIGGGMAFGTAVYLILRKTLIKSHVTRHASN